MIQPFWGEFGLVPAPLEVSHNYCSHKCAFCFANLNSPGRTADVKGLARQLQNYSKQKNYAALMLQAKMCVAVSNKTDPFARSNYKIAVPMMETLTNEGVPVFIQTRGGVPEAIAETLQFLKPSIFYISITQTNEEICKLVEPGAPSTASRWALVDQVKAAGHKVMVAANPYNSNWIDNDEFLRRLEAHRPDGLVLQLLHLNPKQIANMSEREKTNVTEKVMASARKRDVDEAEYFKMMELHHRAQFAGIKIKNYNAPELINDAVPLYGQVYGNSVFKTKFEFVEWCRANKEDNDIVTFEEYRRFMLNGNPFRKGEYDIKSYLSSQSKAFRDGVKMPSKMSFTDVLKIAWNDPDARKQPNDISTFGLLQLQENGENFLPVDDDDNIYFVWNSQQISPLVNFSNQIS